MLIIQYSSDMNLLTMSNVYANIKRRRKKVWTLDS